MKIKLGDTITADTASGQRRQGPVERINLPGTVGDLTEINASIYQDVMLDYRLESGKLAWCYGYQVLAVESGEQ